LILIVFIVRLLKFIRPPTHISKEKRKPKKEKRKPNSRLAQKGRQGFSKKYYPTQEGGDFFENPKGLTLPDAAGWMCVPAYLC
jgi:hypothetical protein